MEEVLEMQMKFFEIIHKMGMINNNMKIDMTVSCKDDIMSVSVAFVPMVEDSKLKNMAPIMITGKIEEIDKIFVESLTKPSEQINEVTVEVSEFEKNLKEAKKNNSSTKKTRSTAKSTTPKKEEPPKEDPAIAKLKSDIDAIIKETMEYFKKVKPDDIGFSIQKLSTLASKTKDKTHLSWINDVISQVREMKAKTELVELYPEYKPEIKQPWQK